MKDNFVKINLDIQTEYRDKLKAIAKEKDMSMSALIRTIIKQHLEKDFILKQYLEK